MTDAAPGVAPARPSLWSRMVGVVVSPRETFVAIAGHPTWLGVLAVTTVLVAGGLAAFLNTPVGRQAWVDQSVATLEGFGQVVDDELYQQLERQGDVAMVVNPLAVLVVTPLMTTALAGLLYGVLTAVFGGGATYRQVLAVVAHTGVLAVLQQLFTLPLNYARESLSSPTNLAVFFPALNETGFLASLLGVVDLFLVWRVFVLAIGLAVLYRRRTKTIAVGLFAAYAAIGLVVALVKMAFAGES